MSHEISFHDMSNFPNTSSLRRWPLLPARPPRAEQRSTTSRCRSRSRHSRPSPPLHATEGADHEQCGREASSRGHGGEATGGCCGRCRTSAHRADRSGARENGRGSESGGRGTPSGRGRGSWRGCGAESASASGSARRSCRGARANGSANDEQAALLQAGTPQSEQLRKTQSQAGNQTHWGACPIPWRPPCQPAAGSPGLGLKNRQE